MKKFIKFQEWLNLKEEKEKKMQKLSCKKHPPKGVRCMGQDLSDDYKGPIARNGTVEPWKIKK